VAMTDFVTRLADAALPARTGNFRIAIFRAGEDEEIVALYTGDLHDPAPLLVRMHSECLTGDVLGSARCDCGEQKEEALARIATEGRGVFLYLRQEGRGIGLVNKIRAYEQQDNGLDTVDANLVLGLPVDARDYAPAAAVLRELGGRRVRLLTNNPAKQQALEACGIDVVERVPLLIRPNAHNIAYLRTNAVRMDHDLPLDEQAEPLI
jgi:GTP cyclohydrolase II